jgi:hypothetical protein
MEEEKLMVKFIDWKTNQTRFIAISSIASITSVDQEQLTWRITLKEPLEDGKTDSFLTLSKYETIIKLIPQIKLY